MRHLIFSASALCRAALLTLAMTLAASPGFAAPPVIRDQTVQAGALKIHYLRAGAGPTTIILLHGWPQSSHEWRAVMPLLAANFTVLAPDLRGVGGTDAPATGYDKATLAEDLHAFILAVKPAKVVVVGHDIGGMAAYAYARLYPREAAGVAILDVPLPAVGPWAQIKTDPRAWHFGFNVQEPLAEQLVSGREAVFIRYFIDHLSANPKAVGDADIARFAQAYRSPARLHAAFAFYRSFGADETFNAAHSDALDTPLLLLGGEHSMGPLEALTAAGLKTLGASDVRIATIAGSGHWLAEEKPAETAAAIAAFAAGLK